MKLAKTLRLLSLALIISLLMAFIPALPAMAINNIELDPEEGAIGDTITITGYNFSTGDTERMARVYFAADEISSLSPYKNIDVDVDTYESVAWAEIGLTGAVDEGEFVTTFEVPETMNDGDDDEDVTPGTYYIYVCIVTGLGSDYTIRAEAEFDVIGGGEAEIYPDKGTVDTMVEVLGYDFPDREDIVIEYDGDEVNIESGSDYRTDSNGDFESVIRIPDSTAGEHTITITVDRAEVELEFNVEPEITVSPQSGVTGTEVTAVGTGFARRPAEAIIYLNNSQVAVQPLDSNGSFVASFDIPSGLAAGPYIIEAEDDDHNLASASITVTAPAQPTPTPTPTPAPTPTPTPTPAPSQTSFSISQETGDIGTLLMVGGAGFKVNGTVTVKYDNKVVATSSTDANGIFTATFQVPPSLHGEHTITASDGTNSNEVVFNVESVAPTMPQPLKPESGVKVKSPVTFDWEEVTDKSQPVTYTLQIATSKDFEEDTIVFEKEDITETEYILTEEDELKLAGQETPYYWRIRSVDAASNPSEWGPAVDFYVGSAFSLPNWALYTLLAVGAVVIFGIGYWLGRRTAFYY